AFTAVEREWLERLARATTESVLSSMLTLPANPDPKDLKAREAVTDDWDKPCK
ncbi:MAG: hypothetical protein HY074_04990, partial [Deltaproteobacteria bacterium]|nr:hypothetical protein [Deltaproteobacteria bacterium]